ncbi:non-homologous end-joining DNA ligase LigD [Quadrisphaera oryzae]|uniref:non-homologous end-joining DNA ligase LigD n=1 Tax=Quadrisphaera TaxID=317661 RepID=UPI00164616E1|nr:ATP-dependent DNA ligase [Quadrisphaera sp. RL12-1S]MBC3761859.1 ATP-dependent DNA ligase [Quadrisphaera sp. RL12-1S]
MARADDDVEVVEGVELKHLDAELFDGAGATKRDLVEHVRALAGPLVAELHGRPLTVTRVRPGQRPFVQKNLPASAPDWVRTADVWAEASQRTVRYPLAEDARTLVWLAGQRAVELHPTVLSGEGRVTHLVLDLDPPPGAPFSAVVAAARLVERALGDAGLAAAVKTSGAKGLHVVVPVRDVAVDDAAAATRALAARAERLGPEVATTAFLLADRGGRVFVDPTRAGGGSLACCYSPRVRPGVPVSFPVPWDALDDVVPGDVTVHNAARLAAAAAPDSGDPWRDALPAAQVLPEVLVSEGQEIPVPRVAAMHEGKRRARARRDQG